jgi:hypothetical protein
MDETVAKLNIEHYRKLLDAATDATRREQLTRLLADEQAKLTAILKRETG